MTVVLALTILLAVGIGVSLGLLGGGGSILAVPLLVYVAGLPPKEAIATSLLVVGATSAVGVLPHARAHRVRWRTGLVFGAAGMSGAYAGGRLAVYLPGGVLLTGFALMMLATAIAMIRGRRPRPDRPVPHELPVLRVIADGAVVGLVTGLIGAGGGFLVVPALALLGGLPMPIAVGTSLLVIAMKSFAGLAGYLSSVHIHWPLAAAVTAAAIAGSLLGGRLTGRIPETTLRKAFGWFVVAMGLFVLAQQLPGRLTVVAAAVGAVAALALTWHRKGRTARRNGAGRPSRTHIRREMIGMTMEVPIMTATNTAWTELSSRLEALGLKLKLHFEQTQDHEDTRTVDRLRQGVEDAFEAAGNAVKDEAVREDVREVGRLMAEALGSTLEHVGAEVREASSRKP